MSRFTDWFLATPEEAHDLAGALRDELAEGWERLSLREIDEPAIAVLANLVVGSGYRYHSQLLFPEDGSRDDTDRDLDEDDELGGIFIRLVPEEFIDALSALDEGLLAETADRWRSRAENLRQHSVDDLTVVLASMRDLATTAVESEKSILVAFEG